MFAFLSRFNFPCRVALHSWAKWQTILVQFVTREGDAHAIGRSLVQERECTACGLVRQTSHTIYYQ